MVDALVSGASVERRASSILVLGTFFTCGKIAEIAQLVEHDLAPKNERVPTVARANEKLRK